MRDARELAIASLRSAERPVSGRKAAVLALAFDRWLEAELTWQTGSMSNVTPGDQAGNRGGSACKLMVMRLASFNSRNVSRPDGSAICSLGASRCV